MLYELMVRIEVLGGCLIVFGALSVCVETLWPVIQALEASSAALGECLKLGQTCKIKMGTASWVGVRRRWEWAIYLTMHSAVGDVFRVQNCR